MLDLNERAFDAGLRLAASVAPVGA